MYIIYIYIYTYIVYMKLLIGTPKLNPKHVARFLLVLSACVCEFVDVCVC